MGTPPQPGAMGGGTAAGTAAPRAGAAGTGMGAGATGAAARPAGQTQFTSNQMVQATPGHTTPTEYPTCSRTVTDGCVNRGAR